MLSGGVRLALIVGVPLLGALLVHETRARSAIAAAVALVTVAATAVLAASVIGSVTGGGSLEHTFGNAVPGVDLATRADAASITAVLVACAAALVALPRLRGGRLCGLLLCLAGTAAVATGANLVVMASGVEVLAAGVLLVGGRRGAGSRSTALVAAVLGAAGLALVAAAAQLVAGAGSSDLAAIPSGAIGGAVAVPWAIGGAALVLSAGIPGGAAGRGRDWAATGALPAGFLVLLRLEQTAGGQIPGNAGVTLAVAASAAAAVGGVSALRAGIDVAAAGRAAVLVLSGILVVLLAGPLATTGTLAAGLLLALEVALVASAAWTSRPTAWSALSLGLVALPGGAAFAAVAVGLGSIVNRGAAAFPELLLLAGAVAAAAVAAARCLGSAPGTWRPLHTGAVIASAAGLLGGVLPGFVFRQAAASLAAGATPVDLDAGAIQVTGAAFAGGYFVIAAAVLLAAAASAATLAAGEALGEATATVRVAAVPRLRAALTVRRQAAPAVTLTGATLDRFDHWLEGQPQLPLFVAAAAVAVFLFH